MSKEIESNRYFDARRTNTSIGNVNIPATKQTGVIRTNCIDCLDRTNVVQSVIGRKVLLTQLYQSTLCDQPTGEAFEKLPDSLEQVFRDIWTMHADALSYLYSGTGALKTDFTRTGKRTKAGALEDGKRSLTRYFLGHFCDPYFENSLDLLLGKIEVSDLEAREGSTYNQGRWSFWQVIGLMFGPLIFSTMLFNMFGRDQSWALIFVILIICVFMTKNFMKTLNEKSRASLILKN